MRYVTDTVSGTLTRRERQRAATVEEIKEVARALMRDQGTTEVRFTDIAKEMGVRLVHGYGMTEVPMMAMGSPHDTDEQLANTDGKPVLGAEIRIVTADEKVAAPDEEGEVRLRGQVVCVGYTDPAVNAEACAADVVNVEGAA